MNEYILHFPNRDGVYCRAVYPSKMANVHLAVLSRKYFCVPDRTLEGGVLLRLCDEREFVAWQQALPKILRQPSHMQVLMVLVQHLTPNLRSLTVTRALLAFARISGSAILRIQEDGSVYLTRTIQEQEENT